MSFDTFVTIGSNTYVEARSDLQTIDVSSRRVGGIDFASSEVNSAFTQDEVQALPVALDVTAVALLAPTVVKGDAGLGNLPSFAGSSQLENGYYINGFDVTNIRNFASYANLPFEAIDRRSKRSDAFSKGV